MTIRVVELLSALSTQRLSHFLIILVKQHNPLLFRVKFHLIYHPITHRILYALILDLAVTGTALKW
jgi:hypothetical protein